MMLNPFKIYENLRQTFGDEPAKALTGVLGQMYEDLTNVVTKVEFNELKEIVKVLAQKVEELAEAQKRTEETVRELAWGIDDLRKQVGGLSADVGYSIEDDCIPYIEQFALNQYGAVISVVDRRYLEYPNGKSDEINLYLEGELKGEKIYMIGESKSKPGKKDFDRFNAVLKRFKAHVQGNVKGFMIGYHFPLEVEQYAKSVYPDIDRFKTFEIRRTAERAS